jgi:hypothetical protein
MKVDKSSWWARMVRLRSATALPIVGHTHENGACGRHERQAAVSLVATAAIRALRVHTSMPFHPQPDLATLRVNWRQEGITRQFHIIFVSVNAIALGRRTRMRAGLVDYFSILQEWSEEKVEDKYRTKDAARSV